MSNRISPSQAGIEKTLLALRAYGLVLLLAALLALAACGSDDEEIPPGEIEVRDGGTLINNGDVVNFGPGGFVNSPRAPKTFTINSLGQFTLILIGIPSIGGTDPTFYTVTTAPATSVAPNDSTTFVIDFPTAQDFGVTKTATVTIGSNDLDEANFTFGVTGTANS